MRYLLIVPLLLLAACGGGEGDNMPERARHHANREEVPPPRVSEKDKDRAAELSAKAAELINARDDTGAMDKAEQAVELDPDKPEYKAQLAYVYERLGRYDDGFEWYLKAEQHLPEPDRGRAVRGAARCAFELASKARVKGQLDEAEGFARRAAELDSAAPKYRLELGHVYFVRKEFSKAAAEYDLAAGVSIGDAQFEALDWKGQAQFHGGEYRPAIETFTELIDRGAEEFEAYGWRAYCWVQVGDRERAISDFNQAARLTKDSDKRAEYEDALRQLMQVGEGE